jgi:SAP domain.
MAAVSASCFLSRLSPETLERAVPPQAYRKGRCLVAQGDVAGLVRENLLDNQVKVSGFVHSEMAASNWYKVSVLFNEIDETVYSPCCVCRASANESIGQFCKHVSALLWACIVLNDFAGELTTPKQFRRPNMKRFESAHSKIQSQVEFHLKWEEIVQRLKEPPPKKRVNTYYNKFITEPVWKKPKTVINDPWKNYTVQQLKQMLKEKGLPVSGKKADLISRLVNLLPCSIIGD